MANATESGTLLFVVGLWRSGTSLVHALLNQHPRVRLMYEAEPFDLWPRRGDVLWPTDWPQRLEFYNQTISRHQLPAARLPARVPAREAALAMYRLFAEPRQAAVIGEKAPAYHTCLPEIAAIFPEARFLVIWRDPLECCRSAARAGRKNRFFAKPGILARMLFGSAAMARGVEHLNRSGRLVCEAVYNEVVAEPEVHLRRICNFAGVPFDSRMLDLKEADVSALPEGDHHDQVRSGIIEHAAHGPEDSGLPPAFIAKGRRYASLWRKQYAHLGLAAALAGSPPDRLPGLPELWGDRMRNLFRRQFDESRRRVFRRIPLSWWTRLRANTGRRGVQVKGSGA